jgi:hypothetical protein
MQVLVRILLNVCPPQHLSQEISCGIGNMMFFCNFLNKSVGPVGQLQEKNRFPRPHHPEIYVIPELLLRQIFCSLPTKGYQGILGGGIAL